MGGAHYPSDTVAGGLLGAALGQKLLVSAELQAGLVAVRTEIEAATAEHAKPGNKIETVPVAR